MTKFMIFDIKKFYTSIKKELPGHSINFAKQHITINKQDLTIIQYSRKLEHFLYYYGRLQWD